MPNSKESLPKTIFSPSSGVHHFEGAASNWVILADGKDFTLIDSGYPADFPVVLESIVSVGLSLENCRGLVITHAHIDHIGAASVLNEVYGIDVWCSEAEADYLAGTKRSQVTLAEVMKNAWNPRVARWAVHAIKAGGKQHVTVPQPKTFTDGVVLDLPGTPRVMLTSGHTPGHASFLLDASRALISGDALVTGHAISSSTGPQMLHTMFHHNVELADETFKKLRDYPLETILPGHGKAMSVSD